MIAIALLASACTASTEAEMLSLAEQLEESATTVNTSIGQLYETLALEYDDRSQLYTRVIDLRLPTTIAIERDQVSRVIPPPGAEGEHERYLDYLGELLLAAEALDAAIASEDLVAVTLAVVGMEVASGALAVSLPQDSCVILVPEITVDLCSKTGTDGYERDVDGELRRFVASFRPAFRIPDTFGDVIRARVLGSLQSDATLVLQNTATRLSALDPGPAYGRLHEILLDYFPAAAEAWGQFEADPDGTDPLLYAFITDSLEAERVETREALELEYDIVLAADADSQIVEILGLWFDEPSEE
jgi:hypothetical protein